VTGASGGIGKQLATILYQHNAKVYIAARSQAKAQDAAAEIRHVNPHSTGELVYLHLDLGDLASIRSSVDEFLRKESRLHVLWNNAGVMVPPAGSKTVQGY
jgi:NAD(P)-dependent dehydrogenase (short-subunit alcohol dehydrogenase family)